MHFKFELKRAINAINFELAMQYSRRQNVNVRSHSALTLTSLKEPAKCSQTRSFVQSLHYRLSAYAQLLKSYSTT